MQILWISHLIPYPPKGGVLQRSFHLTRELCRYHEVDLIAFIQKDLIKNFNKGDIDRTIAESKEELRQHFRSIEYIELPSNQTKLAKFILAFTSLFRRTPYTLNWLRSTQMDAAIKRRLNAETYDLVHLDTISLDVYRKTLKGVPVALDHHNIESHMMIRRGKKEKNLIKKAYYLQEGYRLQAYEQTECPKYAAHITCSRVDSERLRLLSPCSTIRDIPNGVDTKYFKPKGLPEEPEMLVFAGRMNWYPNVEAATYLVDKIFPRLLKKHPKARLVIAGANPPPNLLKRANRKNIEVTGFVDDIRPYIERSSVYVCPIMDGGGTKLKILDALSMGMPIVASSVAAEGIEVEDGTNILFADSPDEYVEAISSLFRSDDKRRAMSNEARRLAELKYDFENIGRELSDFYLEVVDRSRS